MQKVFFHAMIACLSLLASAVNAASELQAYVQQCQNELHFNASDVKPMNCNNGVLFAGGGAVVINDFLVYQKINDTVDLAAACRWIDHNDAISTYNGTRAASIELIIHNRQNGETCFFQAKDIYNITTCTSGDAGCASRAVSTAIVSPTNFNPVHSSSNPNADDFWLSPTALNNKLMFSDKNVAGVTPTSKDPVQCVGCHAQGPFIASYDIVGSLAQYGLLNNRHDTYAKMSSTSYHYHVVGSKSGPPYNTLPVISAFQNWDNLIALNDTAAGSGDYCATCHALADKSTVGSLFTAGDLSVRLLPSINSDIGILTDASSDGMPPYEDSSNFRWINLDTPVDGVETENFADAIMATNTLVPTLLENCAAPGNFEAHAVGVPLDLGFSTAQLAQLPDRLRTFSVKEGLVCLNSDQENGKKCSNYNVSYYCPQSGWINSAHPLAADGDHEERSTATGVCTNPVAIKANVDGTSIYVRGPNDHLARLSPYGLTCNNVDQPDKQCSNYVVRYSACTTPAPTQFSKRLINVFVVGKQLTAASGSLAKGQSQNGGGTSPWNTQQWNIEPIAYTEYVRIHNPGTNVYLTVNSTSEQTTVNTAALNTSTNEMWTVETVSGSSAFRLKNLFSGRYLTIADPKNFPSTPDYLPIYSQALNTGWTSQLWVIQ